MLHPRLNTVLVYHWNAWDGFLVSHLVAEECCVPASYEDDYRVLELKIHNGIQAVLWQMDMSVPGAFPRNRQLIIKYLENRGLLVLNSGIVDITKVELHNMLQRAGLPSAKADRYGHPNERLFVKSNFKCVVVNEFLYYRRTHLNSLTTHPHTNFKAPLRIKIQQLTEKYAAEYQAGLRPIKIIPKYIELPKVQLFLGVDDLCIL